MVDKKIKILHVIGTLEIGGAENVALNFYRYADKEKFQMDYLVYNSSESEYSREVRELGGNVIRLTSSKERYKNLLHIMHNGKYRAVHSHLMFHNGIVMRAAFKAGVTIRIAHAHSTSSGRQKNIVNFAYEEWMRLNIRKYATEYIACGKMAGNKLFGLHWFKKYGHIIYNSIPLEKFRYSDEAHYKYRKQLFQKDIEMVILMIGHLIPLKNHKFALELMQELSKSERKIKLYILGDGELKTEIIEKVFEKKLNNVELLGNVINVNQYMISADLLIMPSFFEGFPMTLIEAQAAGLPCMVSNNISHEVDLTGMIKFIGIDNVIEWARAIDNMNIKRKDMINKMEKKGFGIKKFKSEIESLYMG